MFKVIRVLSDSIQAQSHELRKVCLILEDVLTALSEKGPLEDRLAELERARHQWEARVEAEMVRIDSRFKAARGSEERARNMEANAEALTGSDDGEEGIPQEYLDFLRRNGETSQEVAVQSMSESVALTPKVRALQRKFGRVNG